MIGCVLSQLKPSELYILSCASASAFFTAKNIELLGLYPIQKHQSYTPNGFTEPDTSTSAINIICLFLYLCTERYYGQLLCYAHKTAYYTED